MMNTGSEPEVNWYTLTFDNPLTVPSGTPIAAAIESYGGMGGSDMGSPIHIQ